MRVYPFSFLLSFQVIFVRPFMTFTNRLGRDVYIKLCGEDEPKVLRPCDSRIPFVYRVSDGPNKLQVGGVYVVV